MTRRVLVVSYEHPPCPGGGSRWLAMAKHLRELGHSLTIVTSRAWGTLPNDDEMAVVRVADLRSSRALRAALGRGKLRQAGDVDLLERPPQAILTEVLVPDMNVLTWLPAMTVTVRSLLTRNPFDCLVTTSPPESSHLVGLTLGRRRPAWVTDFRDGWGFEPWREPFPTTSQQRLDGWLERRVTRQAEVAVGATQPIARDLRERLGANAIWVPNGWDPAAAPARQPYQSAERSRGALTLVYTGTLSGGWGRDPEPLLRALVAVSRDSARPLRLIHAGRLTTEERTLIDRSGAQELVEHVGTLDRASTLSLQRSADALVLLTSRNSSEATGKLFEYLASGRPILALAEGNEAARIVAETHTGLTVPPDDPNAIVAALRLIGSGDLEREYQPQNLERYTYPGPAIAMAAAIDEAIDRRRATS